MCGRYVIISTPEAIRTLFGYGEQPNFPPRYNVAQTQPVPIVRLHDGKRSFALMRWGLLPSWVKDPKTFPLLINARGESVHDKPAFRNAMRRRRCLIPTDGFYEWQASATPGPPKRPYFVRAKRGADGSAPPLAFAGTAKSSIPPPSSPRRRTARFRPCTSACRCLLHRKRSTCGSTAPMSKPTSPPHAPADEGLLEVYEVSTAVNRVVNDTAALIAPVPAGGSQAATNPPAAKEKKAKVQKPKPSDDQASLF